MVQNDNIYGLFDSICQIDQYLVVLGVKFEKYYFGRNTHFLGFLKKSHKNDHRDPQNVSTKLSKGSK